MYVNFMFTSYVYHGAKIQNILGELCFEQLLSAEFLTLVLQVTKVYYSQVLSIFDMTDSIFENVVQNFI